jgi:hypothetical protein
LADRRVVTVSDSKIRHLVGGTKVWTTKFTTYHLLRANICLLFDSYPQLNKLAPALLVSGFNTATNWLFCLKNKNADAILGSLQALFWAIRNFHFIWSNKLNHWSKSKVTPKKLAEKFTRIQLPTALYLFPSKISAAYQAAEIEKYEKNYCLKPKNRIKKTDLTVNYSGVFFLKRA